jgi:hypothetical protein
VSRPPAPVVFRAVGLGQARASPEATSSSARTGGVPAARWPKGIKGRSKVDATTLLEKNPRP